ncbi:MAG TPA: hypothetical protein VHB79_22250 [Polyangiaceae bacterium]|nr:hypothetical protein [Polyangiaceae bacterium]
MSRAGFQKSVRMFHKFSQETLKRRGGDPEGRESVEALAAIDSVLKAEKLLEPGLLEPLAAFTNLLQSSQLPPDFGNYSFADALLAIEDAHAELRQNDEQRWEFEPELDDESAAAWLATAEAPPAPSQGEHATKLESFVLEAAKGVEPGSALVVGALSAPELPLAELAQRFERLTLSDIDLASLEALVKRVVPEPLRAKLKLERYDVSGSYGAFTRELRAIVADAASAPDAVRDLLAWLQGYDVGAGSAGLSAVDERPALAISAMLLGGLGRGYAPAITSAFKARGWDAAAARPLGPALSLLGCLVQQHHVQALLRRAQAAVLVSAVSQVELRRLPNGQDAADGEPHDLLLVERLSERLPQTAPIKAQQSWEHRHQRPDSAPGHSLVTLIEAVLV